MEIAIGSAFEFETQLILYCDLHFFKIEWAEVYLDDLHVLQRQINSIKKDHLPTVHHLKSTL
ncbi:MAG: hypothetical protein HKN87_15935 [Saprospiraceae bacterium]|nr:hypothetical protein [Saprospiraceae bacterium]